MQKPFWVAGIIALVFLLGCTQSYSVLPKEENACSQNLDCGLGKECIQGTCEKLEPLYTFGGIGENVSTKRTQINVESFEILEEFNGKKTSQKFLVINFSAKNLGESTTSLSYANFELLFEEGMEKKRFAIVRDFADSFIQLNDISPGETRQGLMVFEISSEYKDKLLNFVFTDKENNADFGGTLVRLQQKGISLVLSGKKIVKSTESFDVNFSLINPKNVKNINFVVAYEREKFVYESLLISEKFRVVKRVDGNNYFEFELEPRDTNSISENTHIARFSFRPRIPGLGIISINESELISPEGEYLSHLQYNHAVLAEEG